MVVLGSVSIFGLCDIEGGVSTYCAYDPPCEGPKVFEVGSEWEKTRWFNELGQLCDITSKKTGSCNCNPWFK